MNGWTFSNSWFLDFSNAWLLRRYAMIKLGVNIDHVATIRQARYADMMDTPNCEPDILAAASACERAGADGITVHLRADRRHIQDRDVLVAGAEQLIDEARGTPADIDDWIVRADARVANKCNRRLRCRLVPAGLVNRLGSVDVIPVSLYAVGHGSGLRIMRREALSEIQAAWRASGLSDMRAQRPQVPGVAAG